MGLLINTILILLFYHKFTNLSLAINYLPFFIYIVLLVRSLYLIFKFNISFL
nr:MAG TPA: hypothetical protein [Caudoviricetes sp.]